MSADTPVQDTKFGKKASGPVGWLDDRLGLASANKRTGLIRKVFPDHWSFLLGEIALYSFIVLLLTGVFLTLWFQPSMGDTVYEGSYTPLNGIEMSHAYASTLDISFDIRGGLLIRQIHHWAANIFVAAIIVHMFRIFFTGAYRKPREVNWLIGLGLFGLSIIEGFAGYSLPDDLLSGTGIRIADGLVRSIPIVGSYLEFFMFGGEYPGDVLIPRLYMLHILLVPALLAGLIGAHLLLVVYHKHTHWHGPGRTNNNVVGYPLLPVYTAKAGGFFFIVFGFIVLMSALFEVNAVWQYGPYNPSEVTAGSQPDWYMGFLEGSLRIMPAWESTFLGHTWSWNILLPGAILPLVMFGLLGAWPFVERWITGDQREHHVLQRPRNAPTRTALGVAGITCYGVFWAAGANDIIALKFHLDIYAITWFARIAVFVGPVIAFMITKRICIGLQRQDNEQLLHGYETGIIERSPEGGYSERHAPLPDEEQYALTAHDRLPALDEATPTVDEYGVEAPNPRGRRLRDRARRFYFDGAQDKPTADELEESQEHLGDYEGHPVEHTDGFRGISETGVPRDHQE